MPDDLLPDDPDAFDGVDDDLLTRPAASAAHLATGSTT